MTLLPTPCLTAGAGPNAACMATQAKPGASDLVRLTSGALEATFAPAVDMTCCSLVHRGVELVGERYGLEAYAADGITMGMSVMHPWADRLSSWSYTACGVPVRLPISPLLHTDRSGLPVNGVHSGSHAWILGDSGAAGESVWLEATLPFDQPKQLELFPFPHRLVLHAAITGSSLTISLRLEATGEVAVPVCFGYRIYLRRGQPQDDGMIILPARQRVETDKLLLPTGAVEQVEMSASPPGLDELHEVFAFDSDRRVTIASGERRLTIDSLDGFGFAQVRTCHQWPHLMVEALTAAPDALSRGLFTVATRERPYRASLRMSIGDNTWDGARIPEPDDRDARASRQVASQHS
jgi:aldose 1-epimerase